MFKRKHKCTDFKWGEPYTDSWTKVVPDPMDVLGLLPPKKIRFDALTQKGRCVECGLVKFRRVS